MIFQIRDGHKQFGTTLVFEGINFQVKAKDKLALIGRNGSGKTTLMKVIADKIYLDSGDVFKNNNLEVGYLSQTTLDNDSHTITEEVITVFDKNKQLEVKIKEITKQLEVDKHNQKLLNEYSKAFSEFEILGGYNYEYEMYEVLSKFGFSGDVLEMRVGDLSGGERTKVAFAKLLLKKPQLLLLDEPTNHLDLSTIEWLEGYLRQYQRAVIIVSHDRVFLDNIVNRVWEIEYGKLTLYRGNYSLYEVLKKTHLSGQQTAYLQQQREIKRLEEVIEKFRHKASKASFAQSKIKYLEKMDKIQLDKTDQNVFKAKFTPKVRGGNKVLELNNLTVGYDKPLANFTLQLYRGDRLGIIGDNGTGKSTLVKTLMQQMKPLSGELLWGHNIEVAYFDQQLAQVDSNKTVLDEIWDTYPDLT
ncbi:MAG: ABC-F family ATP-binding cassette domain-containing protein, partial [Erysipelothrix sp.]|nr:ABC-F family ATP-binding cassette domain-containing protein [Erysipelothrix sp.]